MQIDLCRLGRSRSALVLQFRQHLTRSMIYVFVGKVDRVPYLRQQMLPRILLLRNLMGEICLRRAQIVAQADEALLMPRFRRFQLFQNLLDPHIRVLRETVDSLVVGERVGVQSRRQLVPLFLDVLCVERMDHINQNVTRSTK